MLYAQVGHDTTILRAPLRRHWNRDEGLSCLSARPHDLATATAAQPEVACVRPSIVPFVYSKRAAAARDPSSRVIDDRTFCGHYEHTSRGTTRKPY